MDATAVAIGSAALAAIIAIIVPWMTFRLALRQDHKRWLREQRSQLYVDILTEAYAEARYIYRKTTASGGHHQAAVLPTQDDLRASAMARARLGARGAIYGSETVNQLFNELLAAISRSAIAPKDADHGIVNHVLLDKLHDQLAEAIRKELGAHRKAPSVKTDPSAIGVPP